MKKSLLWIVILVMSISMVAAFSLYGCKAEKAAAEEEAVKEAPAEEAAPEEEAAPAEEVVKEKVIGVSLLTREHVFYNMIEEAVKEEAEALGFELIIMDANKDSAAQASQVENFITQEVDAIILCPCSSAGIKPSVGMANKANIPVFTMDIAAEGDVIAHVGTDNYTGGILAGKYTAEEILKGKGTVAIITYSEVESCVNRELGFKEAVAEFPDIEIVDVQNCGGSAEKAADLTQDILVKYPDLDVIFGVGDPFAMGALSAIEAANKEIKIIGFDGNPEAIAEIKKGELWIADVAQNPKEVGKTTVNLINDFFEGKDVPKVTLVAPYVIDISNLE